MSRPFRLTRPVPSEADVKAGCLMLLELRRWWVGRNHAGTFQSLDGRRIVQGAKKGTPDYYCAHGIHRPFFLELKRPGGRLSEAQEIEIEVLALRYGLATAVVDSVESLLKFLAQHERGP